MITMETERLFSKDAMVDTVCVLAWYDWKEAGLRLEYDAAVWQSL